MADIREDSQKGLTWFQPTWDTAERSRLLEAFNTSVFETRQRASPVYRDSPSQDPPAVLFKGHRRPSIRLRMGKIYSVDVVVQDAKRRNKPEASPEGRFALLKYGQDHKALKFIDDFGPLIWPQGMLDVADWVHLDDFWCRKARFTAVSRLWQSLRDGDEAISQAWDWIRTNYDATKIAGESDLGYFPDRPGIPSTLVLEGEMYSKILPKELLGLHMSAMAVPMPWQLSSDALKVLPHLAVAQGRTHEAIARASASASEEANRRVLAIALIQHELTMHTRNAQTAWRIRDEGNATRCTPFRSTTSLWSEIWEIFAAQAANGLSWRYCRECGRPFYPKRVDSDCCTTEEQKTYSKRDYAARMRKG